MNRLKHLHVHVPQSMVYHDVLRGPQYIHVAAFRLADSYCTCSYKHDCECMQWETIILIMHVGHTESNNVCTIHPLLHCIKKL